MSTPIYHSRLMTTAVEFKEELITVSLSCFLLFNNYTIAITVKIMRIQNIL